QAEAKQHRSVPEGGDAHEAVQETPIWIPDLRATMCMICTCEFTLTWRRHHCRACGKVCVVCQACSTNKYYLEYLKNQPARVCDHCFAKLQENSEFFHNNQQLEKRDVCFLCGYTWLILEMNFSSICLFSRQKFSLWWPF
uniref:FYVE, RhoGEF and PH domain containing 6 n=1 Tax=Xiphophorus couchianus TaxID=32473 RepID=A0A3B5M6B0_9TELE